MRAWIEGWMFHEQVRHCCVEGEGNGEITPICDKIRMMGVYSIINTMSTLSNVPISYYVQASRASHAKTVFQTSQHHRFTPIHHNLTPAQKVNFISAGFNSTGTQNDDPTNIPSGNIDANVWMRHSLGNA